MAVDLLYICFWQGMLTISSQAFIVFIDHAIA